MSRSSDGARAARPSTSLATGLYRSIYAVIRRIPRGRVATYGQVAEVAGLPRGARVAAAALKVSDGRVPWQRVVGKADRTHAKIAILDPVGAAMQRAMLEKEGVAIGDSGRIDLTIYGWRSNTRRRRRRRRKHRRRSEPKR